MSGWGILGVYGGGTLVLLLLPFLRRRLLLLPGRSFRSVHLLLASVLLTNAALFPEEISGLPGPLLVAGSLFLASVVFRNNGLLLGPRREEAMVRLEECCERRGIALARDGERLVLKRLGAAVDRVPLFAGVDLIRLDHRRREPALEDLQVEWRRAIGARSRRR